MVFKANVLLLTVIAAAFVGKSVDAIKCYQCNECPDTNKLPGLKECTKVTWVDSLVRQVDKMEGEKKAKGGSKREEFEKMAAKVGVGTDAKPATCFKQYVTFNKEVLVYRGCAPADAAACGEIADDGTILCICHFDGCNSAPTAFIPSTIAVFLSIVVLLFM